MNKQQLKIYRKEYREKNLDKAREYDRNWKQQYRIKNPDKAKEKRRERYYREKQNPEWLKKHKEYMREYNREWNKNNPQRAAYRKDWMKKLSSEKKIVYILRNRIKNILIRNPNIKFSEISESKYKIAKELLGVSVLEARQYIESKFKLGMTWENHGEWHIDHSKPLALFDITKIEEQKKAFNYKNLQPLWAKENLSKGKKYLN